MADCRTLLVEEAPQKTDINMDQSILEDDVADSSCWLMEPVSPISTNNTSETVADLQSSSDSFCLICDKVCRSRCVAMRNSSNSNDLVARLNKSRSSSSADKSPVVRAAAGANNRITVYVNSSDKDTQNDAVSPFDNLSLLRREKPRSLGVFRSAIIRQLWEIHRLLLALVQETSTLKKRRDSAVDEWHGRSLSAVEMPLDSTSATSTNHIPNGDQPVQTGAIEPAQPQQSQRRHSHTLSKQELSDRIQQKRQQLCPIVLGCQPATATSRSASVRSFVCAQTSGKQLYFASTICIGPTSNASAAKQVRAKCGRSRRGASKTTDSDSQSEITLLSKRFVYKINNSSTTSSSASDEVRFSASARLGTASSSRSNSSFSFLSEKKVSDVIVFQRALHDSPVSSNKSEKRQQIVATLSRLKLRIDAIKLNLVESLPSEVGATKSARWRKRFAAKNENNIWPYYLYRPNRFETRKIRDGLTPAV